MRPEVFEELQREIQSATPADLEVLDGQLAQLNRRILVRMIAEARPLAATLEKREDRWLTPAEAAPLLRTSVRSLSRRWKRLSFCRPPITGRGFRVSLTGLQDFMRQPTPRASR
jgi:hypothetical protein